MVILILMTAIVNAIDQGEALENKSKKIQNDNKILEYDRYYHLKGTNKVHP